MTHSLFERPHLGFRGSGILTPRELQVVERVVLHCETRNAIAAALAISNRTVEMHLSDVLRKLRGLGIENRVQLCTHVRTTRYH